MISTQTQTPQSPKGDAPACRLEVDYCGVGGLKSDEYYERCYAEWQERFSIAPVTKIVSGAPAAPPKETKPDSLALEPFSPKRCRKNRAQGRCAKSDDGRHDPRPHGCDRNGNRRDKCGICGRTWYVVAA